VAVVGFDDAALAAQVDPPLTTVHQPVEAMGRQMARTLCHLINGDTVADCVLDTHLVRRDSA
jgi:DNA-binding LacI/PurR family transcriptional regulator